MVSLFDIYRLQVVLLSEPSVYCLDYHDYCNVKKRIKLIGGSDLRSRLNIYSYIKRPHGP